MGSSPGSANGRAPIPAGCLAPVLTTLLDGYRFWHSDKNVYFKKGGGSIRVFRIPFRYPLSLLESLEGRKLNAVYRTAVCSKRPNVVDSETTF